MLIFKSHSTSSVWGIWIQVSKGAVTKHSFNWCCQLASSSSECLRVPSPEWCRLRGVLNILSLDISADAVSWGFGWAKARIQPDGFACSWLDLLCDGCVLFSSCNKDDALQHTACVSAVAFLRFSFQGLMYMLVYPMPLVFCALSIKRLLLKLPRQLCLISGMLQEPP